ncbi:MAG: lipase secretion chaperone [bacterium]
MLVSFAMGAVGYVLAVRARHGAAIAPRDPPRVTRPAPVTESRRPIGDAPPISTAPPPAPAPGDSLANAASRALEGTSVDGELVVGLDGHFRPTAAAIRLFRHFMTANGEWSRDQVRRRIESEIDARLAPPASAEARAFLDQYVRYLDASRSLDPAGLDARDLAGRLSQVRDLQRSIFGAALAEALFGSENALAEAALDRLMARLHATSTAETPAPRDGESERDGGAEDRLPPEVRAIRERAAAPIESARQVESLRRGGADPEEVRAERVARFGADAAARLEDLDRQRAQWEARLAAYRVARDAVLRNPALDTAQRTAALERVREERFSGDEIRHVAELDRLDASAAAMNAH